MKTIIYAIRIVFINLPISMETILSSVQPRGHFACRPAPQQQAGELAGAASAPAWPQNFCGNAVN